MTILFPYGRFLAKVRVPMLTGHKICCTVVASRQTQSLRMLEQRVNYSSIVKSHISSGTNAQPFLKPMIYLEQRRFKRKRTSKQDQKEDDDDDDDDELSNENPLLMDDLTDEAEEGSEYLTIDISSLRLDSFCKTAFSVTRAKVEELFYKGDIYVNGELPAKKSIDIGLGDEIDLVKSTNLENSKLVNVKRAVILGLPDKASEHNRFKVSIQRWMNISVESRTRRDLDRDWQEFK